MYSMPPTLARTASNPKSSDSRSVRDKRIVFALVGIFVIGALAVMSMSIADASRKTRAKAAMGQTFAVVHRRQSEFRSLTGRFATWPELKQRGATLRSNQSVNGSNADASHWFISIRDTEAGVICDRIGELMDEDSYERTPVCRDAP